MLDFEIEIVRAHNWSLKDIDETDVESLLMFAERYGEVVEPPTSPPTPLPKGGRGGEKLAYIDEVAWL